MKNDVNGQIDLLDLLGIEKEVEQKPEKETETKNTKETKKLKMFQILLSIRKENRNKKI